MTSLSSPCQTASSLVHPDSDEQRVVSPLHPDEETGRNDTISLNCVDDSITSTSRLTQTRWESQDEGIPLQMYPKDNGDTPLSSGNIPQAAQPALRPLSRRPLARAVRDAAFAIVPLYFLVFAILTYRQDGKPSEERLSLDLLAAARYGPTIFGIMFAAVVGRFFTCMAAAMLERGTSVGVIECVLGSRTVFGAVTLPLRFRFLHPIMLLLALSWAVSPLGGQAALRVIGTTSKGTTIDVAFRYLDTYETLIRFATGQSGWRSVVTTSFNAALGSPMAAKESGQDIYGNLKIPLIEPSAREGVWHDIANNDHDVLYSSLTGLPLVDGLPSSGHSKFNLKSWYAHTYCSVAPKSDLSPPSMWALPPGYPPGYILIYNNLTLTFLIGPGSWETDRNQPVPIWMISGMEEGTNATCSVTAVHVETRMGCDGTLCKATAVRKVATPEKKSDTSGPHINIDIINILKLLASASKTGWQAGDDWMSSPVEQYFVNQEYPFASDDELNEHLNISIGDLLFSQRFTQVLNTIWLAGMASSLALGGPIGDNPNGAIQLASTQGTTTVLHEVIVCHTAWFWVLCLASLTMLLAGSSAIVVDLKRRGPDVLDGLSLALRENKFVYLPTGNSMDDGDDIARRFKKVKIRLGDVQPQDDFGHVAVGTPEVDRPVNRLMKGRRYV